MDLLLDVHSWQIDKFNVIMTILDSPHSEGAMTSYSISTSHSCSWTSGPGPGRLSIRFCTYFWRWRLSDEPHPPAPHMIVAVLTQGPLPIANSGRNFVKLPSLYRHTWILLDMPSYLRLTLLLTGLSLVSRPPGSFSPLWLAPVPFPELQPTIGLDFSPTFPLCPPPLQRVTWHDTVSAIQPRPDGWTCILARRPPWYALFGRRTLCWKEWRCSHSFHLQHWPQGRG